MSIAGILAMLGNSVVTAENGREALERWQDAGPFDCILMDVQMPVMSGLEALRHTRAGAPARRACHHHRPDRLRREKGRAAPYGTGV